MRGRERHLLCCSFSSVCCVRVFSSCAGLYVRALFVKKGICACTNLPLNSYPAYYSGPISDEKRDLKQRKRGEKGGQFFRFDGGELLAEWSTRKRDFGFFFHLVVETDLSEKKVVFSFVSGNTQLTFVGENTHQSFVCEENAERTRERDLEERLLSARRRRRDSLFLNSFFLSFDYVRQRRCFSSTGADQSDGDQFTHHW